MDNLDFTTQDSLLGFNDYTDNRANSYPSYPSYLNPSTWPLSLDIHEEDMAQHANELEHDHASSQPHSFQSLHRRPQSSLPASTPLQTTGLGLAFAQNMNSAANLLQPAWQFSYPPATQTFAQDGTLNHGFEDAFGGSLQASSAAFLPVSSADMHLPMHVSGAAIPMNSYLPMGGPMETLQALAYPLDDYQTSALPYGMPMHTGLSIQGSEVIHSSVAGSSPTGSTLEVCSLSSSDNGWAAVNFTHSARSLDTYGNAASNAIFNPGQTLHIRTDSESSSDESQNGQLANNYEDMPFPLYSPASEFNSYEFVNAPNMSGSSVHSHDHDHCAAHSPDSSSSSVVSPVTAVVRPLASVRVPASSSTSPTATSPPLRRRKSPTSPSAIAKTTKAVIKKESQTAPRKAGGNDKRVGKRRGPLRPDQRQQAHEIRKLRACLRCKFLKKTCDKGDPCAGCRPSHARLWQVPCTRIDIKDIGYFMKDWKVDFERHVTLGFSINNIKGFSSMERTLYITHGYGHYLPINAREVFVNDDNCFGMDWVETINSPDSPIAYEINTPKLAAGMEGVSSTLLSEYLDLHLEQGFEEYIDKYFEGTPFLTDILKTAYRYSRRSQTPVVRKALKLVVAYTLTMHVTLCEGLSEAEAGVSRIDDETSRYVGKTMAPVMIHFQVKCALADMWRELQKDILEELSSLYSSVYQGDKLRHWPTIFMLASILLAVWELMQFDSHYREPDESKVDKFCDDMESTPVGVIIGLFQAISQKLPSFMEWNTEKHKDVLKGDAPICDALTEVREHVLQHETYLRSRVDAKFDRNDFDCLSNKFLSRLVIRAN